MAGSHRSCGAGQGVPDMACTSVNVVAYRKVVGMGKQTLRQQARQEVREARMRRAAELRDREKQCAALAEAVLVALGERDEAELRAGRALVTLTSDQGLTLASAVSWCGGGLNFQEAKRLRRLALADGEREPHEADGLEPTAEGRNG